MLIFIFVKLYNNQTIIIHRQMSSGYKLNMSIALLSIKLMSFFLINVKYPHNNQLKDIEKTLPQLALL